MVADAVGLQGSLRSRLVPAMTGHGWALDPVAESMMGTALIGAFRRRIDDDFSVTASFEVEDQDRRSRVLKVFSEFGMSYDRSYRLWPVASGFPRPADVGLDDDAIFGRGQSLGAVVRSEGEVEAAAKKLAAGAERSAEVAGRYASVDALVDYARSSVDEIDQIDTIPLLLAAAGRTDEARAAISEYRSWRQADTHDSEYRAFVARLTDWMDSGSPLPDLPGPVTDLDTDEWPDLDVENYPTPGSSPSLWEAWRRARESSAKSRAASEAVRAEKEGKSRAELGEMLKRERAERGLETNPRFLDMHIDAIGADSRAEKREVGFRTLGNILSGFKAIAQDLKAIDDPAPEWMEPPIRAGYRLRGRRGQWITIETDADAAPILEQAVATANHNPLRDDQIDLELWLDWHRQPTTDGPLVAVHLGSHRVATLDANTTARYRADMEAAATQGLLSVVGGRLIRTPEPPGYHLQIQSPTTPSNAARP